VAGAQIQQAVVAASIRGGAWMGTAGLWMGLAGLSMGFLFCFFI
jgi:hypothetical protein